MKYLRNWLWAYCLLMLFWILPLGLCGVAIAEMSMLFVIEPVTFILLMAGAVSAVYVPVLLYCIDKYPKLFEIHDWL